jgi:hypothetical protein
MSSIQIDLYSALTGANIDADKAKAVVESLQEHIDMQVSRANEAVLAKLDGMQAKTDGALATLMAKIDAVVSGRIDPNEKASAANLRALVSGRIDPIDKAVAQLVSDKQARIQRVRWVVGTMLATVGAGYTVLHTLHLL